MVSVSLGSATVLFEPGQAIDSVCFPLVGLVALVGTVDAGTAVAVATVGTEGIVGVPLVAGGSLAVRAICASTGTALTMPAAAFREELDHPGPLNQLVQTYTQTLFGQISQSVGCNRLHSSERRLSRWLLALHDGAGADEFDIGHHVIGQMLGCSRQTVRRSIDNLELAGVIHARGAGIRVLNRPGLEDESCECYEVVLKQRADRWEQGGSAVRYPTDPRGPC